MLKESCVESSQRCMFTQAGEVQEPPPNPSTCYCIASQHPARKMQFLMGRRGGPKGELCAIGGSWEPCDGGHPEVTTNISRQQPPAHVCSVPAPDTSCCCVSGSAVLVVQCCCRTAGAPCSTYGHCQAHLQERHRRRLVGLHTLVLTRSHPVESHAQQAEPSHALALRTWFQQLVLRL